MVRFGIERGAGSEKSEFASPLPAPHSSLSLEVFTTRVDTTFGVTFVVLAPEHELVKHLTTPNQQAAIDAYIDQAKKEIGVGPNGRY